jgi:hypothetical protein
MKKILCLAVVPCLFVLFDLRAASTINSTNSYAWGANIGWTNWRPSAADGVAIGEFICSGYIWGANVGWINLGNGFPVNNIQYQNNSAADFGVNYGIDPTQPGYAILRGYAYGANIGWINLGSTGNPRLRFSDGRLEGYAYAANCGWINLGDATFALQTDTVAPGLDSDNDGMADAFEFQYLGGLGGMPNVDTDGDGMTNLEEYLNGTLPNSASDNLRITAFSTDSGGANSLLSWTSTPFRLYTIETSIDLLDPNSWAPNTDFGVEFAPDPGRSTTKSPLTEEAGTTRFWRVRAIRPLVP